MGSGFLRGALDGLKRRVLAGARESLAEAVVAVCEDLVGSGLIPFESGHLQNSATYVDAGRLGQGRVAVVSDTVYARRKFFNPEFDFDQSVNKRAGGRWFDVYLNGARSELVFEEFAGGMKERVKRMKGVRL